MIPQTVLDHLHHADHNVRSEAVRDLDRMDHPDKLGILIDMLRGEPDTMVREDITYAITRIGSTAVPALAKLLKDDSADVRHHAAHVLGKIGHTSAVAPLLDVLADESARGVVKAVFVLQQIGDPRAISGLVSLLDHDVPEIQTTLITALSDFGVAVTPALINVNTHERWDVRERAIEILGLIGDEAAIPALITALDDEDWRVRVSAVTALGQYRHGDAINALRGLDDDPDRRVQALSRRLVADLT